MIMKKLQINVSTVSFKSRPVRCAYIDNQVYIAADDIAKIANVINFWDKDYGIMSSCRSAQRVIFYADKSTLWAIQPHDVPRFCKINKRNLTTVDMELIKWAKELPKTLKNKKQPESGVTICSYQGSSISFENRNGAVMVNATQMAKPFGDSKRVKNWTVRNSTVEFLEVLSKGRNLPLADLVQVTKGGNEAGTWMHEDVAIEFARWLSPSFGIWCNDRVKELLNHGMTALPDTIDQIMDDPDFIIQLATKIKNERRLKELAIEERDTALHSLKSEMSSVIRMKPKEEYYDMVVEGKENYSTASIAGELDIAHSTLRKRLYRNNIVTSLKGEIVVYPQYKDWLKSTYSDSCCRDIVRWTKKGRAEIIKLIKPQMPI